MVDVLLAIHFFIARIYLIYYILSAYGRPGQQSAWTVFHHLRLWCQLGTGSLWMVNAMWWLTLLRKVGSSLRRRNGLRGKDISLRHVTR